MYIWQDKEWPEFWFNQDRIASSLIKTRHEQGRLLGRMEALGFNLTNEAVLITLTQDVLTTSEIEGEILDPAQVRSSIARQLGIEAGGLITADRNVDGIVEMTLDATSQFNKPLTRERLFDWHASLFPTGSSRIAAIRVGAWRDDHDGPMQVVSGPLGQQTIHFEAPPAVQLDKDISVFLDWYNDDTSLDGVLKAGMAHLWFVTIHPFDDGNGRIARAIADMTLARTEQSSKRFYSVSSQIRNERRTYYKILERTQRSSMNITDWLDWFLGCMLRAIDLANTTLESVIYKADFWERFAAVPFNDRQIKMINRILDGLEGKLTTSKWAKLAKCSQDTAYRDILDLIERRVLKKNPEGGRSTNYSLIEL